MLETEVNSTLLLPGVKSPPCQEEPACLLGHDVETDPQKEVYLYDADRPRHTHILGVTGSGKTTFQINSFVSDVDAHGHGGVFVTPSTDTIRKIVSRLSEDARKRTIILDPDDDTHSLRLNLLACPDISNAKLVTYTRNRLMHIFGRIWDLGEQTPSLQNILSNTLYALILNQFTLAELPNFLRNETFRSGALAAIPDDPYYFVRWFWSQDYNIWSLRMQLDRIDSTTNKVLRFLDNSAILHMVCQKQNPIDFYALLREKKIMLVPLSDATLGDSGVKLIGTMLVSSLLDGAARRSEIPERERELFVAFFDEFELYASLDFATMLERVRELNVGVTIAHQHLGQISGEWLRGSLEQTGMKVTFRTTVADAPHFAPIYARKPPVEWRNEPIPALTRKPCEKLCAAVHPHKFIAQFSEDYLADLVYFGERLDKESEVYVGKTQAAATHLQDGRYYLDNLLTDVMTGKLVPGSKDFTQRVSEIVVALRGYIGLKDSAQFTEKYRLTHQFVERRTETLSRFGEVRQMGTGYYDIRKHMLPTGEDEVEEIEAPWQLQPLIRRDLQRRLERTGRELITLSLADAKFLGFTHPEIVQAERAILADMAARRAAEEARIIQSVQDARRKLLASQSALSVNARDAGGKEVQLVVSSPSGQKQLTRSGQRAAAATPGDGGAGKERSSTSFWLRNRLAAVASRKPSVPAACIDQHVMNYSSPLPKYRVDQEFLQTLGAHFRAYQEDALIMRCLLPYLHARFTKGFLVKYELQDLPRFEARIAYLSQELEAGQGEVEYLDTLSHCRPGFLSTPFWSVPFLSERKKWQKQHEYINVRHAQEARAGELYDLQKDVAHTKWLHACLEGCDQSKLVAGYLLTLALFESLYREVAPWRAGRDLPDPPLVGISPQEVNQTLIRLMEIFTKRQERPAITYDRARTLVALARQCLADAKLAPYLAPYMQARFLTGFLRIQYDTKAWVKEVLEADRYCMRGEGYYEAWRQDIQRFTQAPLNQAEMVMG